MSKCVKIKKMYKKCKEWLKSVKLKVKWVKMFITKIKIKVKWVKNKNEGQQECENEYIATSEKM